MVEEGDVFIRIGYVYGLICKFFFLVNVVDIKLSVLILGDLMSSIFC